MRIGIFGGSFDPVHFGHLLLAEAARETARLDEVWFVPAAIAPHKGPSHTPGEERAAMLDLAVADNPAFRVARTELARGGVSYTVDTLSAIHNERPTDELFLLLGADSLADLPTWREPARVCSLALPIVARRADAPEPDFRVLDKLTTADRVTQARDLLLTMPIIDLRSRELRRRVTAGLSIRYQTPPAVVDYIARHGLYGGGATARSS